MCILYSCAVLLGSASVIYDHTVSVSLWELDIVITSLRKLDPSITLGRLFTPYHVSISPKPTHFLDHRNAMRHRQTHTVV
jgi:hypothetical protein